MAYQHIHLRSKDGGAVRDKENVRKCATIHEDGSCTVFKDGDGTPPKSTIEQAQWAHWVDGYPVVPELVEYVVALRKRNRHLRFAPYKCEAASRTMTTTGGVGNAWVFAELMVYTDTCDYALGKVGFKDCTVPRLSRWGSATRREAKDPKYFVLARGIKNEKVLERHEQHNMAISEKLDRIVPKALANLREYLPQEYPALSVGDFYSHVLAGVQTIANESTRLINACGSLSVLEVEIRNLIKQGVEFVTPEFKRAAAEFLDKDAEAQGAKMRKIGAYHIRIYERLGEQRCEVITYNQNFQTSLGLHSADDQTDITLSDLPEDVQMKLAPLTMMQTGAYVPGNGMRVSVNRFWVERDL